SGRSAARDVAKERRGKAFEPAVSDAFLSISERDDFWTPLEEPRIWDQVLSLEPPESPHRFLDSQKVDDLVLAFADYTDLKSPYLAGHSRRVGTLAESMAQRMAFRSDEIDDIRRAGLAHDIGLVAVPSFVLDRPEDRLTEAEREQYRLHPYHSQRILA